MINFPLSDTWVGNGAENFAAIYHYSVPTVKLAYPEPFVASASLMHGDLWFIHILVYQYWLWFAFVFLIVFFFITFIWTVRWCNMRIRPRRETRGVSRSKCGDLITACVPVSWATSIIVNESTDAIDYFDGFGTSELVIGIRAYQWGWEYYYPKDLDLNYSLRNSFASMIGNSLKYESTTAHILKSSHMWKSYQGKFSDAILNPISMLLRTDVFHILNLLNFSETGSLAISESTAFRKIQIASKMVNLVTSTADAGLGTVNYKLWDAGTETEASVVNSIAYGLRRQTSVLSKNSLNQTFFDNEKIEQFLTDSTPSPSLSPLELVPSYLNFAELDVNWNLPSPLLYRFFNVANFVANSNRSKKPLMEIFSLPLLDASSFPKSSIWFSSPITPLSVPSNMLVNSNIPLVERTIRNAMQLTTQMDDSSWIFNNDITSYFDMVRKSSLNSSIAGDFVTYRGYGDLFSQKGVKMWMRDSYFDATISPIVTTLRTYSIMDYDTQSLNANVGKVILSPFVQSKEEMINPALLSVYWNSSLTDSDQRWRLSDFKRFQNYENLRLTPFFDLFYDYDFRNWQSLELLEDAMWEDTDSTQHFDEYRENLFVPYDMIKKDELSRMFVQTEQEGRTEEGKSRNREEVLMFELSPLVTFNLNVPFSIQNFEMREIFQKTPQSLNEIYLRSNLRLLDDTVELTSFSRLMLGMSNNQIKQVGGVYALILSTPVSTILNSFRSNLEETSFISSYRSVFAGWDLPILPLEFWQCTGRENFIPAIVDAGKVMQMSEIIEQRNSAKNLIVSSNAIVKIFKNRYDDFRSLARLRDFSDMEAKQFLISNDRINYEMLLKKNNSSFFAFDFFKAKRNLIEMGVWDLMARNISIFDFPFITALKSEAARYIWLDWFSKWNYVDIQPSSSARYAIFGMPYFNKAFDFNTAENEIVNDTETYFMRIARARKNYLPLWTFSPFLFLKNNEWAVDLSMSITKPFEGELDRVQFALISVGDTFAMCIHPSSQNHSPLPFNPSFSSIALYTKSFALSNELVNLYYFHLSILNDTLTKRESVIRAIAPNVFDGSSLTRINFNYPQNSILNAFSNLFLYRDTINQKQNSLGGQWGRGGAYRNLIIGTFTSKGWDLASSFENSLLKNQYRPLRKGVNNMLRLHATGAIAMPTEMRMQILASSKDVIHSWAIPSAGIKIDCVPGYSSHRIMIFLVSGIFWGQCMEVCGRYHHWMPIVVYFMKKDLFFLWCSHFVFFNSSTSTFALNSRQHESNLGLVTHDKFSWLTEMR